jgi:hypothetical protein
MTSGDHVVALNDSSLRRRGCGELTRLHVESMLLTTARDLWMAELRTAGASTYTLRNYTAATEEAFSDHP